MKKVLFGLVAVAALALTSCAKFPQAEIDSAKAAIEVARGAEAEKYASADFAAVQDSLNSAIEVAEQEKAKFLFKSYDAVVAKLTFVTTKSAEVKVAAETKKAEVKAEVETLLTSTKALVEENKELMKKAPKGKEGKAALEAIASDITTVEAAIAETESLFAAGDFLGAQSKIKGAAEKGESIKAELTAAIDKKKGKK